jgi:hypothetical protein
MEVVLLSPWLVRLVVVVLCTKYQGFGSLVKIIASTYLFKSMHNSRDRASGFLGVN